VANTFRQIIQYDEDLGHKYVENLSARLRYGNDGYFIETDKRGFRNSPATKNGKIKIIVLGDSYAAGDGLSNQYRFSDILENEFDCSVTNLAVSGYGVDQQLLAYEKFKGEIEHDLVIFAPHLDDLKRNLLSARTGIDKSSGNKILIPKPFFSILNEELKLNNVPVPRERTIVEIKENTPIQLPAATSGYILKKYNAANYHFKRFLNYRLLNHLDHPELSDSKSAEWKLMGHLIKRLISLADGKPIYTVPIPFIQSVGNKEKPAYIKQFRIFESKHFQVLDISSLLHQNKQEDMFLPLCGHFSPIGHKVVAKVISELLMKKNVLKKRESTINEPKAKGTFVLGISCFYHDSAAALIHDGKIVAAAQEERFTRVKHDKAFPENAINYCLEEAHINIADLKAIVYYDYESWTIERVLHNADALGPRAMQFWEEAKKSLYKKLKLPVIIRKKLNYSGEICKTQHHISHAASAYYPSGFDDAAILIIDGVGEWACSTIATGKKSKIQIIKQQFYPHSLGLLYSAFTSFCGFKVNSGEYKLMGLAPYGEPKYADMIKNEIVDIKEDGSIFLNLSYFSFLEGEKMTNDKFASLFGGPERKAESRISKREMDIAASIQKIAEEIVIKMANHAYHLTKQKNLVMAGGVALNCVCNGKLFDETPFENFFFQPASGDAGGALGCALDWYYQNNNGSISESFQIESYAGPEFSTNEIAAFLHTKNIKYNIFKLQDRAKIIAEFLSKNKVVGYFDGKMEFGPRALGNRSILANPIDPDMQSKVNLKIKFRESFRPFAPIYAEEKTSEYFEFDRPSPFMLIVRKVKEKLIKHTSTSQNKAEDMIQIVNQVRSELPAITHIDYSARLQSVNRAQNAPVYDIIKEFEKLSGKAALINTSFNVRGEPIVCTPADAYKCFMRTDMDVLVLGNYFLLKEEQENWKETENWQTTFELD
jgi:carbamoyltransferase